MTNIWRRCPSGRLEGGNLLKRFSDAGAEVVANAFFEAEGGPAYFGILKRWTGVAWVKDLLKTYLGGSFQAKPLKRWDGSEWKLVDSTGV